MPEVSILIPTYNRADFLLEAVKSVRSQSFSDWEIVIVDDGSTDDTREKVADMAPAIRYVYQENQGVSVARNRAFRTSNAPFVVFLDSDDFLVPDGLATLLTAHQQIPETGIVFSDGVVTDEFGTAVGKLSDYRPPLLEDTLESYLVHCPVDIHSAMFRRSALEKVDGPFDEKMLGYEDWDLIIRLKAAGCAFRYIPEITSGYRFHGGNKSAPRSTLSERRREALEHNRMKVLSAPWFDGLGLPAREQFFFHFLTGPLKDLWAKQEAMLQHASFKALPAEVRSRLLFYLAVENLLGEAPWGQEARHLAGALRLRPSDPRPFALLLASLPGLRVRRQLIRFWRRLRATPDAVDPVTRILREKNVA